MVKMSCTSRDPQCGQRKDALIVPKARTGPGRL
jgi:hypothetical protein